jgi:hypothetical protein
VNWLKRPDVRYSLILAAVVMALWAPRLRGPIDLRYDAGVYYILGTSLAEGRGYRLLNEPGDISVLQYPPLLPALVAVEQKVLGTSDPSVVGPWLRWTYCAIFFVYSLAIYRLARSVLTPGYSFAAALICTLSCDALYLSDLLQAELPFAAVTVLFALSARSFSDGKEPESARRFALTALLATAAFLIRSAGVALMGAWVGEAVLRRQWKRAALRCVVAAVPFLGWQAWVGHVRGSAEYAAPTYAYQRASYQYYNISYVENLLLVDSFKPELGRASNWKIVKRVVRNSLAMPVCVGEATSLSKTFVGWSLHWLNFKLGRREANPIVPWKTASVVAFGFGAATLAGALVLAIRRRWFVPLYICGTLLLICLTPWPKQFQRYLFPLSPFLVLSFVTLMSSARERVAKRPRSPLRSVGIRAIPIVLAAIPVMETVSNGFVILTRHEPMAPGEPKLFYIASDWVHWAQAVKWVGEHSAPADVVATSAPHQVYLQTGLKSVMPPMEHDSAEALRLLDSIPVRYLIVATFRFMDLDARYADPVVRQHPSAWKLVFTATDGETRVYERVH